MENPEPYLAEKKGIDPLFRWLCLGIAVLFLIVAGWMINDIRLHIRRSAEIVKRSGENINEHLPSIVQKSKQTTDLLSKNLPEVVDKVRRSTETVSENLPEVIDRVDRTTEVVAELAEDIRQLKELAGLVSAKRDENLVAYANSVFRQIETAEGMIGNKKVLGKGIKNALPAKEWVVGRRKWALWWTVRAKSKKELLEMISKGWYMEFPDKEPIPLIDWLREKHAETKALE